jgi:putative oxidoreductase
VLFSLIFLGAAPRHFSAEGIRHAAEFGWPGTAVLVPLSGVMAILGALSLLLGWRARLGALLLIAFLAPITFTLHAFWNVSDPVMHHVQLAMFAKNVALMGGALMFAYFGAGPLSVDEAAQKGTEPSSPSQLETAR